MPTLITAAELGGQVLLAGSETGELRARRQEHVAHAVNVRVVQPNYAKANRLLPRRSLYPFV